MVSHFFGMPKYIFIETCYNGGRKAYFGLENNYKAANLVMSDKKKLLFETLVTLVILYGYEVWD